MRDPNARLFVTVSLVSGFGSTAMMVVAPVWTLDLTGSSSLAALCGLFLYVPTLLAPLLGSIADRLPRRALLIGVNLLVAGLLSTLFAVRSPDRLWLLFTAMLGYGLAYVMRDAAETALLAASLPTEALGSVNGLRMSAREGMKLIAPLAGAGLYTWAGGPTVAMAAAGTLLVAALLYARLRVDEPRRGTGAKRTPMRFLLTHQGLRRIVLVTAFTVAMSAFTTAALYEVIVYDLHLAPAFAGVVGAAQGGGSIVGGVVAGRMLNRFGTLPIACFGAVVFAAGSIARCVPSNAIVLAASAVIGIGLPWTVVATTTAEQQQVPNHMLGGVAATTSMVIFAPLIVAIPVGAGLTELVDHRLVIAIASIATIAVAALILVRSAVDNVRIMTSPRTLISPDRQ